MDVRLFNLKTVRLFNLHQISPSSNLGEQKWQFEQEGVGERIVGRRQVRCLPHGLVSWRSTFVCTIVCARIARTMECRICSDEATEEDSRAILSRDATTHVAYRWSPIAPRSAIDKRNTAYCLVLYIYFQLILSSCLGIALGMEAGDRRRSSTPGRTLTNHKPLVSRLHPVTTSRSMIPYI